MKKFSQALSLPFMRQFKQGLVWNLIDSVGSQGLLILFHLLFRNLFGAALHGAFGCTLSVVFLAVIICNGGLDATLAPFLETFTRTRKSFRRFIWNLILPQLGILTALAVTFYYTYSVMETYIPIFSVLKPLTHPSLISIMCLAFVSESMRKTLRVFLQLSFYTPLTASVEITGTALYIPFVLGAYVLAYPMTLMISWLVVLILSLAQLFALSIGVCHYFRKLEQGSRTDESNSKTQEQLMGRIFKTRLFAWANQCIHQLFSGNFLVPLCALHFGIEQASLMKVITSISHWITLISQKVFGITGNALLAHLKTRSLATQQEAFHYLTKLLNQTLYFLLIFFLINGKKLALLQLSTSTQVTWSLLYFMLLMSFFDGLFVLYEKWYILEEKAQYYFFFNAVSFGILYSFVGYLHSPIMILLYIIILRMSTFILLTLFSFYQWKIWPSFKPSYKAVVAGTALSLLFYAIL